MNQDHAAYPKITQACLDMIGYNGGLHRFRADDPEADVKRLLDEYLGSDGTYAEDLDKIEAWLAGLTEDQFMLVCDGEESEVQALLATAPAIGESTAAEFFDGMYEHCI